MDTNEIRKKRKIAKEKVETLSQTEIRYIEALPDRISFTGYVFCKEQMQSIWLSGVPVIDCKTFALWKKSGYKIKKWEKAKIWWVSWKNVAKENQDDFLICTKYVLFHRSQVEKL